MHRGGRATVAVLGCLLVTTALGVQLFAQASFATTYQTTDFSGEWWAVGNDVPFAGRMPFEVGYTAELYDYSGLPFNDAGRARADAGDISDWSIPEFVCRPHPGPYNWYLRRRLPHHQGHRSDHARARRLSRAVPAQRRSPDLHGRPAASAGVGAAHLVGVLHRQVRRQHARRDDDAHSRELHPRQHARSSAKRRSSPSTSCWTTTS